MKKLFTLLTLLLMLVGGAKAKVISVTVPTTGWSSGTSYTYQSADASVSVAFTNLGSNCSSSRFEVVKTTTMTVTVPTGGLIKALVFTMDGTGSAGNFTYTLTNNSDGGNIFTLKTGDVTFDFPTPVATTATFAFGTDNDNKSPYARVKGLVVKYDDGVAETEVANPVFTPAACEFNTSMSVTLSVDTEDATIYYTTDGSTPTASSSAYTSAINITETTTIKAIGIKAGLDNSEVVSQTYTFVDSSDPSTITNPRFIDFSELTGSGSGVSMKIIRTEGDYRLINDAAYPMTVYTQETTIDGYDFVRYLNLGGGSSETRRLIEIKVGGPATIKVWGKAAGSSGTRKLVIAKDSWSSTGVANVATNTSDWSSVEYTYTGSSAATFYIGGDNNIHIAGLLVTPTEQKVSTLSGRNYASYVTSQKLDFASADGITAYIATGLNGGSDAVVLQEVDVVPAGEPIIVKTDTKGATVNVPVTTADASDVSGNLLVAGDGTTTYADGTYYFLKEDKFHLATSGTLQTGKAYLQMAGSLAPVLNFAFGDVTGINEVQGSGFKVNGYYDLQGRKVVQPTKGLYIVNGKKIVIK